MFYMTKGRKELICTDLHRTPLHPQSSGTHVIGLIPKPYLPGQFSTQLPTAASVTKKIDQETANMNQAAIYYTQHIPCVHLQ